MPPVLTQKQEWLGGKNNMVENNYFEKGNTSSYDRAQYPPMADPVGTLHKYTIDWTSTYVKWYVDDVLLRTLGI
jgi:beta-glucanase (GH16 family)